MPASTFQKWRQFYDLDPWGPWRDNYHAALIAAILSNVNRPRGADAFSEFDFIYLDPKSRDEYQERKQALGNWGFMQEMAARAKPADGG